MMISSTRKNFSILRQVQLEKNTKIDSILKHKKFVKKFFI